MIKAYGEIPDEVINVEVWLTNDDELVFQEINLRRPGTNTPICIEKAWGINYENISFDIG